MAEGNGFSEQDLSRRRDADAWLQSNGPTLPAAVAEGLARSLKVCAQIDELKRSRRGIFRQLMRAMRLTASSERHTGNTGSVTLSKDAPKGSTKRCGDDKQRLDLKITDGKRLENWHRHCADNQAGKVGRLEAKKARLQDMETANGDAEEAAKDDDAVMTSMEQEQAAAEEKAERRRQSEDWLRRSDLGGGQDPRFAPLPEALMEGMSASLTYRDVTCGVDEEALPRGSTVVDRMVDLRQRIDFSFNVTVLDVEVEKATVATPTGNTLVSASVEEIGPPKMAVTWAFLTSVAILASLYAMPFHRLARLVSTPYKRFTSTELARYFQFVARQLLPLYVYLGMRLADAPVISGDDTTSKVLMVSKALEEKEQDPNTEMPWDSYATPEKAQYTIRQQEEARNRATKQREQAARELGGVPGRKHPRLPPAPSLAARAAAAFGFAFERKDGNGSKISFNTTVLTGRADPDSANSTIIFYRSHLGSVGNLLDVILSKRKPDNRRLVVQTDLATTNLIKQEIAKNLDLHLAGCAAHARRPFKLHFDDDPEPCEAILHFFKGLAVYDNRIDLLGRNETNTLAVRDIEHRNMWELIRRTCDVLVSRWSRQTELGKAARYVIRHYDKLTYYLKDAYVAATNNLSERMLRMEKLIGRNALFRKSLDGRCALDIIRTILQTAIAAGVNPAAYLQWVLRMPVAALTDDPAEFTPWAYAKWLKESAETDVAA